MVKNIFKKKIKLSSDAKAIINQLLIFAFSFFFTPLEFIMGLFPFGICFSLAVKRDALFSICGAFLSVFFFMDSDPVYLITLLAVLILRTLSSFLSRSERPKGLLGESRTKGFFSGLYTESVALRVWVSVAIAVGMGIYYVIVNGYQYYDMFSLVFSCALFPVLTYAFSGLYEINTNKKHFVIALGAILFCLAYGASGKELFGIDLSIILSYMLVLYVSKNVSAPLSCALGALLGIATNFSFAPAFALAGIISGLSWQISPYLAIMSAFVLSLGYGIFASGYDAIVYFAPEILGASLIMYPLLRFDVLPRVRILSELSQTKKAVSSHVIKKEGERLSRGIEKISSSFGDISKMFYEVSEKSKSPDKSSFEKTCLSVCEAHCFSCPKEEICWEKDIDTTKSNICKMGDALYLRNEILPSDFDEKFLHRCPNVEKIVDEINTQARETTRQRIKSDKLLVCASNFDLTSKMISSFCQRQSGGEDENDFLSERASRQAHLCGLHFEGVEILGVGKKQIIFVGVDTSRSTCTLSELGTALSKELGIRLGEPVLTENGGFATVEITTLPLYETTHSVLSVPEGGEPNGDSVSCFKTDDGREYFLICDGMGTGKSAALTSGMCVSFLEKILEISNEKETALSMLNNFVRAKGVECSSSVDLLEIDLSSGDACFLKSGAAPSFIKRGERVFKLQSKTAPIGIMKRLDCEKLSFNFEVGDVCVMISDGAISDKSDGGWLRDYLKTCPKNADTIASDILNEASRRANGRDDISVLVVIFE